MIMKKNFAVIDAVAIQDENGYHDIHNYFDLSGLVVSFIDREVKVRFDRCDDGSVATVGGLILQFSNVDYLDISPGVFMTMVRDVVEFGYKSPNDFDHDWLKSEIQADATDHFFIRLSGDEFIRVHGKTAATILELPQLI